MAEDSTAKKEEEIVDDSMMGEEGAQAAGEAIEESIAPFEESSLEEKVKAKTKDKLKSNKSLQSLDFILDIPLKVTVELGRTKMNIKESMQCLDRMIKKAKENNLKIRAGIQCVWGCAYDGFPNEKKLFNIINSIAEMEPDMISLADSMNLVVSPFFG